MSVSTVLENALLSVLYNTRNEYTLYSSYWQNNQIAPIAKKHNLPKNWRSRMSAVRTRLYDSGDIDWFINGRTQGYALTAQGLRTAKARLVVPTAPALRRLAMKEVQAAGGSISKRTLVDALVSRYPSHDAHATYGTVMYSIKTAVQSNMLCINKGTVTLGTGNASTHAGIATFVPNPATKSLPHIVGIEAEDFFADRILPGFSLMNLPVTDPLITKQSAVPVAFTRQKVIGTRKYGYKNRTVDFFVAPSQDLPNGLIIELKSAQKRTSLAEVDTIVIKDIRRARHGIPTAIVLVGEGYDGSAVAADIAEMNRDFSSFKDFSGVFTVRDFYRQVQLNGWKSLA